MEKKKKNAITETERLITDAQQMLQNMEKSISNSSKEKAEKLQSRCRQHRQDLARLEKELGHVSLINSSYNTINTYQDYDDIQVKQLDQRTHLLEGYDRIQESSDRLSNAHRIAVETEDIGVNVLGELHTQKQTLLRARDNLGNIDDNMTRSRKILSSMARRIALKRSRRQRLKSRFCLPDLATMSFWFCMDSTSRLL
jgi:vesicle transport through interaction with t-SNAREs protein 1